MTSKSSSSSSSEVAQSILNGPDSEGWRRFFIYFDQYTPQRVPYCSVQECSTLPIKKEDVTQIVTEEVEQEPFRPTRPTLLTGCLRDGRWFHMEVTKKFSHSWVSPTWEGISNLIENRERRGYKRMEYL